MIDVNIVAKITNEIKEACIDTLEESATEAVAEIKAITPVKTGNLRRSITHSDVDRVNLCVEVGSNLEYAEAVEEGHDQQVGKYIPAIGKKLVKEHVKGVHMIRDGLTIVESKMENKLQNKLEERLSKL